LKSALEDAKKQNVSTLIDLKVLPKTMTDGYDCWWNIGIAETSSKPGVLEAYDRVAEGRAKARSY